MQVSTHFHSIIRADFINRFKILINIDGKNYAVYAAVALVAVFINSHNVNNALIIRCFIFIC